MSKEAMAPHSVEPNLISQHASTRKLESELTLASSMLVRRTANAHKPAAESVLAISRVWTRQRVKTVHKRRKSDSNQERVHAISASAQNRKSVPKGELPTLPWPQEPPTELSSTHAESSVPSSSKPDDKSELTDSGPKSETGIEESPPGKKKQAKKESPHEQVFPQTPEWSSVSSPPGAFRVAQHAE